MTDGQVLALIFLVTGVFTLGLVGVLAKTDIGQAIADAIRHNSGATKGAAARRELEQMRIDVEQLRGELDQVHNELAETHERLDFAERILARGHEGRIEGRLQ
ncbi:MAG TPA: hypothetical protein VHW65_05740 [Gemmatimonadales bacterium]|jgi:multidrug resistance efflux pump|nr:hypothetical protein [Gemmatimonadales bacterium]